MVIFKLFSCSLVVHVPLISFSFIKNALLKCILVLDLATLADSGC